MNFTATNPATHLNSSTGARHDQKMLMMEFVLTILFPKPRSFIRQLMQMLRWAAVIMAAIVPSMAHAEKSVTLAWDPSPTPTVVGYTIQYGTNSGQYSEFLLYGNETTAVVSELQEGVTYYFVVTAHTDEGLESDPSNELMYTVPDGTVTYLPPSINLIPDLIIDEDDGQKTVPLIGLTAGITSSNLIVSATSSNPSLIQDIAIALPSNGSEGFLVFTPVPNGFGSAIITVTANNLQPVNNLAVRTFTVTAYSINDTPTLNPLNDLTLESEALPQLIHLSGIGTGAPNEAQLLSVSATSSDPGVISIGEINYSSPSSNGILTLVPVSGTNGLSIITVTVSDGQHQISQRFNVTLNPPPEATYYLEAESGTVRSPMIVAASTNASNGRYVYSQSSGQGDLTFNLTTAVRGQFVVWCRILSPNSSTDSFYVSVDNGAETVYSTAQNIWSRSWQWTRINDDGLTNALVFPLQKGAHSFRFRSRESSTLLDSVYVTSDRDFVPVHLTLTKRPAQPQAVELSFQSAAGYRYAIDYTSDFRSWSNVWSVSTNLPVTQIITYSDSTADAAARFYRVRVNP